MNALGEVWLTSENRRVCITILEEALKLLHDTVTAELNLTQCQLAVGAVSPAIVYQHTRRVCELHKKWSDDLKKVCPRAPSINQVLQIAGGNAMPSEPPEFLSDQYSRDTQDHDLNMSMSGVADSAPGHTSYTEVVAKNALNALMKGRAPLSGPHLEDTPELDIEPFTEELRNLLLNSEGYLKYWAHDLIKSQHTGEGRVH